MTRLLGLTIGIISALGVQVVHAQPEPAPVADGGDAKALLQSGLKLFAAKDYRGALAAFTEAQALTPSRKILLNIGTTLLRLDRKADAANAYQGYLDATDVAEAKKVDVRKVLEDLDRGLGVLELEITPADAEVKIAGSEWAPAATVKRYRVAPSAVTVRARHATFKPGEQIAKVAAGETRKVELALEAVPVPTTISTRPVDGGIRSVITPPEGRSRFGVLALAHVDPVNKGAAVLVGAAADVVSGLQVRAAALLGPSSGGYLGASFAFLSGGVRPMLAAGMPVFVSDGARFALRGGGGVEVEIGVHVALIAEVGVEYLLNPGPTLAAEAKRTLFIPVVGVVGRL